MSKEYTHQDINQFFEHFKKLPSSYELDKVHQLINSPNAKATHRTKFNYKSLKFIIMTSAFIVGVTTLLFMFMPDKQIDTRSFKRHLSVKSESVDESRSATIDNSNKEITVYHQQSKKSIIKKNNTKNGKPIQVTKENILYEHPITEKPVIFNDTIKSCTWPVDTTIDKNTLFIYLTNNELVKLGVYLYTDSMYYCHQRADSTYYVSAYNTKWNKSLCNNFKFSMVDNSDILCTTHRWGDSFYNKIDTLLPVVINISDETKILWFTPHTDIFKALPSRYQHLERIYDELICIKKRNPKHQIVNYWDKSRNQVLDEN
jgi:hypothetical protein